MDKISKKIEYKLKKIINKLIEKNRTTFHLNNIENVFYFNDKPNILILRHDKIGDLIISTSFINILKKHFPNWNIDIILSKNNINAKKCIEKYVSKIYTFDKNITKYITLLRKLNKKKYDLIIDLLDNPSTTSAIIIKYANPTFALGIYKTNWKIYDYTVPMLDRFKSNVVERVCNLLIAFGINPKNENLNPIFPANFPEQKENFPEQKEKIIAINLAGSNNDKFYGIENNENLIKFLINHYKNYKIRIFKTEKYTEIAKIYKTKYPSINIEPTKTFDELANEIAKCNLVITPDTSVVHLCACFNIPVICLYIEPENHSPWFPLHSKYSALITKTEQLSNIPIEKVIAEIKNHIIAE